MGQIGFIGYGNMGKMIIENILNLKLHDPAEMIVSNRNISKLNDLKDQYSNINITDDNKFLAESSDKIFIFVETSQFKDIIYEISPFLNEDSHIIHVCAGLSFDNIANIYKGSISQIIPSIISTFNKTTATSNFNNKLGISLISHNKNTSDDDKCFVEGLFNEFSYIEIMDDLEGINDENIEKSMEIATILTSCGPAFISLIIENLAKIANTKSENGISVDEAKNLIIKTFIGTMVQIGTGNMNNINIISKTATKKGITETGLNYLDTNGINSMEKLIDLLLNRYFEVKKNLVDEYFE